MCRLWGLILQHAHSKPTLIFCSTRKAAQQAAQVIAKQYESLCKTKQCLPWLEYEGTLDPVINTGLKSNCVSHFD
jgi:phosphohistidine phosphatase SixA